MALWCFYNPTHHRNLLCNTATILQFQHITVMQLCTLQLQLYYISAAVLQLHSNPSLVSALLLKDYPCCSEQIIVDHRGRSVSFLLIVFRCIITCFYKVKAFIYNSSKMFVAKPDPDFVFEIIFKIISYLCFDN